MACTPTAATQGKTQSLDGVKEHKEIDHKELISCYCKLCSEKFESPEEQSKHRKSDSHQKLSDIVDEQFMLQKGNIFGSCYILENED